VKKISRGSDEELLTTGERLNC